MYSRLRPLLTAGTMMALSFSVSADELALRAYLGIPLGGGMAFYGMRADFDGHAVTPGREERAEPKRPGLDLRFQRDAGSSFAINGVAVPRMPFQNSADDDGDRDSSDAQSGLDWYQVAGIAVGIGLIVAVATADTVKVSACSGVGCPPPDKPEPEPEPTTPEDGP